MFKTVDGWLTLSLADGETLAKAFGDPQFATWTKEDQFDQRETVNELVARYMTAKTTAAWEEHFAGLGMWCARVRDYDQVLADPQVTANQSILEFDDPEAGRVRLLAHPIRYDGKAPPLRRPPPGVGQHTDEVLKELGYGPEKIAALRETAGWAPTGW